MAETGENNNDHFKYALCCVLCNKCNRYVYESIDEAAKQSSCPPIVKDAYLYAEFSSQNITLLEWYEIPREAAKFFDRIRICNRCEANILPYIKEPADE